jgi:hypothetical protein
MYTQVSFGQFLDGLIVQSGVELKRYPNPAIDWSHEDWGYEILSDMSVRVFRYGVYEKDTKIAGPRWDDPYETRESSEPRFECELKTAMISLQ